MGHELEDSKFQVQRSNRTATLPPHKKKDEDDEPPKMTIALVVEVSVTVNNIPALDCTTPDDHIPPILRLQFM